MDIKLGPRIASLRRAKSMTQEQLALSLGVSPPAVSKWETGASCPDISLLCPLARALETNVDTLLQFEETLTEEQIDARLNEIVETARNHGYEAADGMVQSLLHTYPSSIPLKSRAVTLFDLFAMLFPAQPQEIRDGWTKQKKQLLEDVRASGAAACWQAAVSHLASIAISEEELEKAESLLKELPQHTTDSTSIWAMLYLKKGEASQALEVIQKRLYVLTRQVQNFLIQMMNPEMTPDTARTLELCVIYRQLEDLLGSVEVVVFPNVYEKNTAALSEEAKIFVSGHVDAGDDRAAKLICDRIVPFEAGKRELWIQFPDQEECLKREPELLAMLADSDGQDRVVLYAAAEKSVKRLPAGQTVDADRDLIVKLEKSFGEGNVKVVEKRIENIRRMQ